MLALSRRVGEKIKIGDDITIHIHKIHGEKVRIGIEAPRHIKILRTELLERESQDEHKG